MYKFITIGGAVAALALVTGCGTVRQVYKPTHLGNLADHRGDSGIEIMLKPDKYRAHIGDPLTFTVAIRNISQEPIYLPAEPEVMMTWVYPDGKRDNLIRAKREGAQPLQILEPGQERIAHSVITTYYFDRGGIHEFRAILFGDRLAMNTGGAPWQGRAVSNGFGVLFEEN